MTPDEIHQKFLENHTMEDLPARFIYVHPSLKYAGATLIILIGVVAVLNLVAHFDPQYANCLSC